MREFWLAPAPKNPKRLHQSKRGTEPHAITGIQLQPVEPPADLAPPKLTASAAARQGVPFRQSAARLEAFNSADRTRLQQFLQANFPSPNLDADMNFRARTRGFEVRTIEQASATSVTGVVQERDSDTFARFIVQVDAAEPHHITRLAINVVPRPAEFAIPRMVEDANTPTASKMVARTAQPWAIARRTGNEWGLEDLSAVGLCRRGTVQSGPSCRAGRIRIP